MVMELLIAPTGGIRCVYGEDVNLHQLGRLSIQRGSHVEPTADGQWTADLSPVNGPVLGPFSLRADALAAEQIWLLEHWLVPVDQDLPLPSRAERKMAFNPSASCVARLFTFPTTALNRAVVSFPMEKFMKVLLAKPNRSKRGSLCQRASKTQKSMNVAKDPAKSLPIKNVTSLPPSILTGEDIVSLMHKHRITIPILAAKLGLSQRRVRLLKHTGLIDAAVIRDWLEAITGQDPGPVPRCCRIENANEGAECHFCRYPLFHNDVAWRYADRVYCTVDCVRKNLSK